ncbi:MAG: WYL domain-containing protein [Coleofasciculaceae cyanobacterium RL_1_1]|nr:WYL domain-containing protein [Coleofasciculaceae cyanobacterium RL_1_1]
MTRKGQAITLSLGIQDKQSLEELARKFGQVWGDKPNISKLVQAIAQRDLAIEPNFKWQPAEQEALNNARKVLADLGQTDIALKIADLLLNRGEVEHLGIHGELKAFIQAQSVPWRIKVTELIERKQPFRLSKYVDAIGQVWTFDVHYAELVRHEGREYLDCWCPSSEGNQDVLPLQHNWCFRLDRYQGSAIRPLPKPARWRGDFDRIDVEFHCYGRLAHSYSESKHDVNDRREYCDWVDDNTYRVVRSIYNTYWLNRELRMHGENCEIIAPTVVRSHFYKALQTMFQRYQVDTTRVEDDRR